MSFWQKLFKIKQAEPISKEDFFNEDQENLEDLPDIDFDELVEEEVNFSGIAERLGRAKQVEPATETAHSEINVQDSKPEFNVFETLEEANSYSPHDDLFLTIND